MFAKAGLVLLTRVLPNRGVSLDVIPDSLARAMRGRNGITLSPRNGLGVDGWLERNHVMTFEEVTA